MKSVKAKYSVLLMMMNKVSEIIPQETLVTADIVISEQELSDKIKISIRSKDYQKENFHS